MANYSVNITNGNGSQTMQKGTYNVTATAPGYDVSTLTPKTFTASESTGTQAFTLTANGTLTVNVNETGLEGGTPITSGSLVLTNLDGTVEYGTAVTIDASGNAVFNNVPYGDDDTPFVLYVKQLSTDENHNIFEGVLTVSMTEQTQTAYIQNTPIAVQTFTLTDSTYGLPIDGTLEFTGV